MLKKWLYISFILTIALLPEISFAQTNIGTMFANFRTSAQALTVLIQTTAYVIGVALVIGSVYKLSQMSNAQGQITFKQPLFMFISGISIFALTGVVSIASQSLAMGTGPGAILLPTGGGITASTGAAIQGILIFIRLVGYIAFIRGFLLLNQYGQGGQGGQGALGRALTHIAGGAAAINIQVTAKILVNTFAPGLPLPF